MQPAETPGTSQREDALRNACSYFVQALETLAADAEAQCEAMGDHNVGRELKHDVSMGRYLVGWPALSSSQCDAIGQLVAALDGVPQECLAAAQGRPANLEAMRDAVWEPLRRQASELLNALSSFCEAHAARPRSGA